jgi:hypothetical protein
MNLVVSKDNYALHDPTFELLTGQINPYVRTNNPIE